MASSPMSEKEVLEYHRNLEGDYSRFHAEMLDREDLVNLYKKPKLPKSLTRGAQVNILSPDVLDAGDSLASDLLPMLTEVQIVPKARDEHGLIPEADKRKADGLEHADAIILDNLDLDRHISRPIIDRQLIGPLGMFSLSTDEVSLPLVQGMSAQEYKKAHGDYMASRFAWSAAVVDPYTAQWEEKDMVPTVMSRRYRQSIATTQRLYSRARGYNGRNGDVVLKGGKWDFDPISDEHRIIETHHTGIGLGRIKVGGKEVRELDMVWLSDDTFVYHIALGDNGRDGKLVWFGEHHYGRCAGFLVPGRVTSSNRPEDRYYGHLYPLEVVTEELNTVRTTRATAARNRADRQAYAPIDPERAKAMALNGREVPSHVTWGPDGGVPYVATEKILEREVLVDPDLDKLDESLIADRQRYRPADSAALSDPSLIKQGTLGALLNAQETAMKKLGPLVTARGVAFRQALEAIHNCVRSMGDSDYYRFILTGGSPLYAAKGASKKAPNTAAFVLDYEALDFPHSVVVSIKAMTMGQAAAQYEYVAAKYAQGDASLEDKWDAANISDHEQFLVTKAKEQIVNDPALVGFRNQQVIAKVSEEIKLEMGIQLPSSLPPGQETAAGAQPPPAPNAAPPPPGKAPARPIAGRQTNAPFVPGPPSGTTPTNGAPV